MLWQMLTQKDREEATCSGVTLWSHGFKEKTA